MKRLVTRARGGIVAMVAVAALTTSACFGVGVDSYDDWQGAVEAGASCRELHDMKGNIDAGRNLDRIERDLAEIGCDSPDSERTDV